MYPQRLSPRRHARSASADLVRNYLLVKGPSQKDTIVETKCAGMPLPHDELSSAQDDNNERQPFTRYASFRLFQFNGK